VGRVRVGDSNGADLSPDPSPLAERGAKDKFVKMDLC